MLFVRAMRTGRGLRILLPLTTALLVGVLMPGAIRVRIQGRNVQSCSDGSGAGDMRPHSGVIVDYSAPDPAYEALTFDEKLDRAFSSPSFHGLLHGVTGEPTVHPLDEENPRQGTNVTDFPFDVRDLVGAPNSPYPLGGTITLRVPGGCTAALVTEVRGAPELTPGEELFVDITDHGSLFGGNSDTVLLAFPASDVFKVRDGLVYGQGSWAAFSEPMSTFEHHFGR